MSPILLTPEGGLPVDGSLVDANCKATRQYGFIGQEGPLRDPFETVLRVAKDLRARYILQTSVGTYYIKCRERNPRPNMRQHSSGEILHQIANCYSISGKHRVWILDYSDE